MEDPSETEWPCIIEHARASNFSGDLLRLPPYPLILLLRTLVGSFEDVTASHTIYGWAPRTTWRTWLFTAELIAFMEASYDDATYDYDEDLQRYQHGDSVDRPLDADLLDCWVRPLSTLSHRKVQAFHYARLQRPFRDAVADFYPTSVYLGFSDGASTAIDLTSRPENQSKRDRWDRLVKTALAVSAQRSPVD
jgi:hypothetical protein